MIPLKFKLDRKSLETMLNSFVMSCLYYCIEVWGCTYDSHLMKLDQLHVDCMRLMTGATKGSNILNLYNDTGWLSIRERRDHAILKMIYKMKANLSPNYLVQLLPQQNQERIRYNLRTKTNFQLPRAKKNVLKLSFVHLAIRLWNNLDEYVKNCTSLDIFKAELKKLKKSHNVLYYYGQRWVSIMHSRLRIRCSKLNYDLCCHLWIPDTEPSCLCGAPIEDVTQFLLHCPNFEYERDVLVWSINHRTALNVKTLLSGSPDLDEDENKTVFDAVHKYIIDTGYFK